MRVSSKMMGENIKRNLFNQTRQILHTQKLISTGKKINKPSDDPEGIGRVLNYRKSLASIDQYGSNIDGAKMRIEFTENVFDSIQDLLIQAKDIAARDDSSIRQQTAVEISIIRGQILDMANSRLNNNYLFSGNQTNTAPFDLAGNYSGDTNDKEFIIGENVSISLKAAGDEIFQGVEDIFTVLSDLQTALETDDITGIANQVNPLINSIDQIKGVRAEEASKFMRLDVTSNQWQSFRLNIEDMLSNTEDADLAAAIIDLKIQETSYEVTLATSASIIQPSLINFL